MCSQITFNGKAEDIKSVDDLGPVLDRLDQCQQFELVCSMPHGPSLFMLRNGALAWLLHLRHEGDAGFHSLGDPNSEGAATFRLSNGQLDEYPISWCIDLERCYKAVSYFFVNDGEVPSWVQWREC
jgi:hypothetical protein